MAKKLAQVATPLSLEDEMVELSNQILSERMKLKQFKSALEEKEDKLIAYMKSKQLTACGVMSLEYSSGSVDWDTELKGKNKELAIEKVKAAIDPKYLTVTIDKDAVFTNITSDMKLVGILKSNGLGVKQKQDTEKMKEIKVNS
jgi:hypothetical protein